MKGNRTMLRPVVTGFVMLCLALLAGCGGAGHAKIRRMTPTGFATGRFSCWVTLDFRKLPPGVDARDVRVVFISSCMPQPKSFDWTFIAANAQVKKSKGVGREKAQHVSPTSNPPLNYPIDILFPLEARPTVQDSETDFLLNVELHWGGKSQDTDYASIRHFYRRQ